MINICLNKFTSINSAGIEKNVYSIYIFTKSQISAESLEKNEVYYKYWRQEIHYQFVHKKTCYYDAKKWSLQNSWAPSNC